MAEIVSNFFGVIGISTVPPENIAELIPYLLNVGVGGFLVCGVFRVIGGISKALINRKGMQ